MNFKTKTSIVASLLCLMPAAGGALSAQTFTEWQDPSVNSLKRLTQTATWEKSDAVSLAGDWKFAWVKDADRRPVGFWDPDYDDSSWGYIKVPGMWELHGLGDPQYTNIRYAWEGEYQNNPPLVPVKNNHVGSYRRKLYLPDSWQGKQVVLHAGAMNSNVYVWVNGEFAGYSEDSKMEPEFDVTRFIKPGATNLIAFQIFRWCDGTYFEDQDYFRFSGISRDCYLYARNKTHIRDVNFTPDLDSEYRNATLSVDVKLACAADCRTVLTLRDADGNEVAKQTQTTTRQNPYRVSASIFVVNPKKWTAETPNLYALDVELLDKKGRLQDKASFNVGFRKIEVRNSQVLVNGQPVLFKGVNRHELDPDGGYVVTEAQMIRDIRIMKENNFNAVRTCHYTDDALWYDLCDKYGLYVVCETNLEAHGMGYGERSLAKDPRFAQTVLERNFNNVRRNFNHPSIIFWSLGNESGDGKNFYDAYEEVKGMDPSRPVQYERAGYSSHTDIFCPMYYDYGDCKSYCENPDKTLPLIQCEYAHAMGNSLGGFKEYWELIRKYPKYQGGFIWDFADQSIRWKRDSVTFFAYGGDFNKTDVHDFNFCNNGLVSPDRKPNPHMREAAYWQQNIWTRIAGDNKIEIYNENFFRSLDNVRLLWEVIADGKRLRRGSVNSISVAPQQRSVIDLDFGSPADDGREYLLNICYVLKSDEPLLKKGHIVARNQIPLSSYNFGLHMADDDAGTNANPPVLTVGKTSEEYVLTRCFNWTSNWISGERSDTTVVTIGSSGFISSIVYEGRELLAPGALVTPNFWRAPTDNDYGAGLQKKFAVWKDPGLRLVSLTSEELDGKVAVNAEFALDNAGGTLTLKYILDSCGRLTIEESLHKDDSSQPGFFRFGMRFPLRASFTSFKYYGRGPGENYSDRKDSEFIGLYFQSVKEQYYPYIRPQETGNKSDVRWLDFCDDEMGMTIEANEPFSFSALKYPLETLDEGPEKHNLHSTDIVPTDITYLLIDKVQMGLGCVNSWGKLPREEYMLPYGDYSFSFKIELSAVEQFIE